MTAIPLNDLKRGFAEDASQIATAIERVLSSGWYVHGPEHARFERDFAAFAGVAHCVGVANGTDALVLALLAVSGGRRGKVVTAANAGGYTTAAAHQAGFTLAYADVDPTTLCLTAGHVAEVIDDTTVAVVVTHLYGRMADMESIVDLCRPLGIHVVEDCAQSVGAERNGARAGSVGDAATFSFYPTKNLGALGDGGAVATSDPNIADALRALRQYGWNEKYVVARPEGRNSRLDEIQAAVLNVRLSRVDDWNARRRSIVSRYVAAADPGGRVRVLPAEGRDHVAHLAVALTEDRERVRAKLAEAGVSTDVHYPVPDHLQPVASGREGTLPTTESVSARVFSLPCFPQMNEDEIERVCAALSVL